MTLEADAAPQEALELSITRVFKAPRELVFDAWTKPEHLLRWTAPEGFTLPYLEGELRPGGAYRCCMRAPDGTEHWLHGTYQEIEPPALLVFTHVWEDASGAAVDPTLVTVRLIAQGKETRMEFHQAFFRSQASRDGHAEGWQSCFGLLDRHLAERQEMTTTPAETMEDSFYVDLAAPRIETRPFVVAGTRRSHPRSEAAFATMEAQWRVTGPLLDQVPARAGGSAAVFYRMYGDHESFDMVAGVPVTARGDLPGGMEHDAHPTRRYAVFAHRGHVSTLRNTVWTIWERWLPRSGCRPASAAGAAPDFIEVYGADFRPDTGLGPIEVWVPLADGAESR